jgi:diguanylate cyclase (GGDEF)-like protein
MRVSGQRQYLKATVDATLKSLSRRRLRGFAFPKVLEDRFEEDTRKKRSRRMWFEGLIAIVGFNICLLLDYFIVNDGAWLEKVRYTALVTPVALAVNILVRFNPPRALREGGVALGMFAICLINIGVEGHSTATSALFGIICVMIGAMFTGVVMRLRFPFVLPTVSAMFAAGVWSLGHCTGLQPSEAMMGDSMLAIGIVIILVASLSLEREERSGYLIGLQRNIQAKDLAWANQTLRELSNIDNLTRLPNRHALDERVGLLWQVCAERREPISAVIVDVDHFKLVNDTHGHLFGDEVLRHIGTLLPQCLPSANDMAARFGGEEFVILLPNVRPRQATDIAEQVRLLVEQNPAPHGTHMKTISVSCGVSTVLPGRTLLWKHLISAADEALYEAKRNGRNRVEFSRCVELAAPKQPAADRVQSRASRSRQISRSVVSA